MSNAADSPLVPLWVDAAWLVAVVLLVVALVMLVRTRRLSLGERLGWAAVIVVFPVLGPATFIGYRLVERRRRDAQERPSACSTNVET
ncbi:PLDc N-terminal domain-containing protein [Gordonia shandongensis]|uniref:PLDc N-terminal domain-containing protein n=1 Tax=Gordonia shandongensis TaxID=376351 RepID=UPI000413A8EA|nr:PLDc N-terminal domain-containing protein [Gordonia shandongensis]